MNGVGEIWKYEFPITDHFSIPMPALARVLTVQVQRGQPCIWARVDPGMARAPRHFRLFGTGHPVPDSAQWAGEYIGTFQVEDGSLVFHLFEDK